MIITSSSILLPLQKDIVFYDNYQAISGDAQIGRPTSSNNPTSFGSEITRLTGELLADTTQMAPYTQIT